MTRRPVHPNRRRRAFTLAELLVVIAIIAVLGGITAVAVRSIAKDARVASAENTITATLGAARARAMKLNRPVIVAVRAVWDPSDPDRAQYNELVMAEWTGASDQPLLPQTRTFITDRFRPVPGEPARALPAGIKVACPLYDTEDDDIWVTQPELRFSDPQAAAAEQAGELVGVMFSATGTLITRNPATDHDVAYIDFNGEDSDGEDGFQEIGNTTGGARYFLYDEAIDEPNVNFCTLLAVYDDEEAREQRTNNWTTSAGYDGDLSGPNGYITRFGRRIHFNRYTGVVITGKDR